MRLHNWRRTRTRHRTRHRPPEPLTNNNGEPIPVPPPPPPEPKRPLALRVSFVYSTVFLALSTLVVRLGYLQIVKGSQFRTLASAEQLNRVLVLPTRGWIYDANGNLLAYNKPVFSIYLTKLPVREQDLNTIAAKLSPVLKLPQERILANIQDATALRQSTIRLMQNVSNEQLSYVVEHKSQLPGVYVVPESQRFYRYGDLGGHIVGYVGPISESTYGYYTNQLKYNPSQIVGQSGLELKYESVLQGKYGYQVMRSKQGTPMQVVSYDSAPVPGSNLVLALDANLQAQTQNILMNAVTHSKYRSDIPDAEAVMLDVKTGGVLALASYPYLDPNWYTDGSFSRHAHYLTTSGAQLNNVVQSPRYPGSTVKPANAIACLNYGAITPMTTLYGYPNIYIGTAKLSNNGEDNGFVNPQQAIAVSSDTFFYEISLMLGKWFGSGPNPNNGGTYLGHSSYLSWLHSDFVKGLNALFHTEWDFGLGPKTGIDLPGEQPGWFYIEDSRHGYRRVTYNLQAAENAIRRTELYVNYGTPVDLAFAGIGQTQAFTPIQLAQYTATIANNGVGLQPHLVAKIVPPNGNPMTVKPTVQNRVKTSPRYLKLVQQGMYDAVNSPKGTAYGVFAGAPYVAAGKTGTAEITVHGKPVNNSVLIAYAPYEHPEIAVVAMVPGGGYGAGTAGPVVRQMMDAYFKEHHEFFPKSEWGVLTISADWFKSPAYTVPEQSS